MSKLCAFMHACMCVPNLQCPHAQIVCDDHLSVVDKHTKVVIKGEKSMNHRMSPRETAAREGWLPRETSMQEKSKRKNERRKHVISFHWMTLST